MFYTKIKHVTVVSRISKKNFYRCMTNAVQYIKIHARVLGDWNKTNMMFVLC